MAYQPLMVKKSVPKDLQQQKLKWLISLAPEYPARIESTIVEIKMAYQPPSCKGYKQIDLQQQKLKWLISHYNDVRRGLYLQQQKLKWLISRWRGSDNIGYLQQQKLKWLISQRRPNRSCILDLQQQKLKWLISLVIVEQQKYHIYNSRN